MVHLYFYVFKNSFESVLIYSHYYNCNIYTLQIYQNSHVTLLTISGLELLYKRAVKHFLEKLKMTLEFKFQKICIVFKYILSISLTTHGSLISLLVAFTYIMIRNFAREQQSCLFQLIVSYLFSV